MDELESRYPDAKTATSSTTSTTVTNPESHDENAVVLASLLQELAFWEPSTPNSLPLNSDGNSTSNGLMRKSRSVNDANLSGLRTHNNNHQRLLLHATSYNNGTTTTSDEGVNRNIYNISNDKGYQLRQNILSYDNAGSSYDITSNGNDDNQFPSSLFNHKYINNSGHDEKPQQRQQQQQQQQQQQNPGSPTLAELQENCFWNKAVDPTSGRTYYYDIRTRQTQWEKPREIKAIEKKIKKDQRLLDEKFFREMERNLLASLARGECIPVKSTPEKSSNQDDKPSLQNGSECRTTVNESSSTHKNGLVPQLNSRPTEETNVTSTGRIRTISCMNEHLLAQIQQPIQLQRVSSSSASKVLEGRPPLPARPTSSTGTTNGFSSTQSLSNYVSHDVNHSSFPSSSQQYENNKAIEHDYFIAGNDEYDDLRLSPEEIQRKQQLPVQDDILRGEELLDGALMLADLEVSDDEDAIDDDSSGENVNSNIVSSITGMHDSIQLPAQQEAATAQIITVQPRIVATTTKGKRADSNGVHHFSHIRRNTAGEGAILTTHMKGGTMEKPDIDSTIHVVCGVIRAHIEQSCQQTRPTPPPLHAMNVNLDIFCDDFDSCSTGASAQNHHRHQQLPPQKGNVDKGKLPSLEEIKEFYREFYQRSQMEFDAIIMSLIYVERLIKLTNGAVMPTPYNWASVVFSCMVLASKVWDDLSMWNIDFSNVSVNSSVLSPFSLKRINELELAVLACLNFAVAIPGSEYAKYYYLLRSMMIRGGLLDPFAAKQQLSTDTTIRLQDRTKHYEDSIAHHADAENPRRRVRSVDWTA